MLDFFSCELACNNFLCGLSTFFSVSQEAARIFSLDFRLPEFYFLLWAQPPPPPPQTHTHNHFSNGKQYFPNVVLKHKI